jgi:integrase
VGKRVRVWIQKFKDRENFVLQWVDPDTNKRKSKSADTADPDEAEDKRTDLESDLNNGRYQEASRMSWEKFRESFEAEYLPDLRENTRKNFAETLDLFEKLCNPVNISGVTQRTISAFKAALIKSKGRGKDPGTGKARTMKLSSIKVRLQFLHTVLNWGAGQKLIPACPEFPPVNVPETLPQAVPTETFERLLAKAPDANMSAYLLCGWLAGMRLNEALHLEWEETPTAPWLNFDRNRIVLPAELVKGGRDQWIPLDPELRRVLEALPRRGKRVFHFEDETGRPITHIAVSCRVSALARAAGVKLTFKSLRRGFGCRYAGKVPAQVLRKLMRHANIKTTLDYYANVDDAVEEAVLGPRNTRRNIEHPAETENAESYYGQEVSV